MISSGIMPYSPISRAARSPAAPWSHAPAAAASSGVKFPAGVNPRGTREFKDEYKRQLNLFRQEHAAKIAAKKEKARAAQEAAKQPAEEAAQ